MGLSQKPSQGHFDRREKSIILKLAIQISPFGRNDLNIKLLRHPHLFNRINNMYYEKENQDWDHHLRPIS